MKGEPIEIRPYERNTATRIIEDFMLAANETVAEDCFWQELPFVYRTHDNPDPDRMRKLAAFINNFGYSIHLKDDEVHPERTAKAAGKAGRDTGRGSDQPAYAALHETGKIYDGVHRAFWPGRQYYCHFTSPIRRYPDLQIHRIIKDVLRVRMNGTREEHYRSILPEVARQSSERERKADEAERGDHQA